MLKGLQCLRMDRMGAVVATGGSPPANIYTNRAGEPYTNRSDEAYEAR